MFRVVAAFALGASTLIGCDEDDGVSFKGTNENPPVNPGGGSDTGAEFGIGGSCDRITIDGTCREYPGYGWTDLTVTDDCNNGFRVAESCAGLNRVGSCDEDPTGAFALLRVFYTGAYYDAKNAPDLQTSCELNGGTWVTGIK